jgi:phosphatidylglycerophosphate synthase
MPRPFERLRSLYAGYASMLKAPEMEETLDLVLFRPLAYLGVRAAERTPVTADQVTFLSIAVGLGAGFLIATATPAGYLWGFVLVFLFNVLDCADGMLARVRGQGSPLGYVLDGLAGYIGTTAIVLGLGAATVHRFGHPLLGWSVTVAAGLSLAWWCAVVDGLRLEWTRRVYGKRQDRAAELKRLVDAGEVWRREGGHRMERLLVGAYVIYVRLWENRSARERVESPEEAIPVPVWAESNRRILRLAVAAGPTMQLVAIMVALLAGHPEWLLVAAIVLGNLWGVGVLAARFAVRRRLFARAQVET